MFKFKPRGESTRRIGKMGLAVALGLIFLAMEAEPTIAQRPVDPAEGAKKRVSSRSANQQRQTSASVTRRPTRATRPRPVEDPLANVSFVTGAGPGLSIQAPGGWPLILAIDVKEELLSGISVDEEAGTFPTTNQQGKVQLADLGLTTLSFTPGVLPSAEVGFGAHPSLPSLVLVADRGRGLMAQPGRGIRARNLAGYFQGIGYELWDGSSATRIVASMIVPEGLFSPTSSSTAAVARGVRGTQESESVGFRESTTKEEECLAYVKSLHDQRGSVTLRAFLVRGVAPDSLTDRDGDGKVTAKDADAAGLHRISNEAVLRFQVFTGFVAEEAVPGLCIRDTAASLTHPPR